MLTTRMSPKISEKPLATMNRSPANVSAFRSVTLKFRGSSIAGPKIVSSAKKRTQRIARPIKPNATTLRSDLQRPLETGCVHDPVTQSCCVEAKACISQAKVRIGATVPPFRPRFQQG